MKFPISRIVIVIAAVAIALAIAEAGASLLHRRAFPYLNLFVADPVYGVRLARSGHTRVRSRLGRVTDIATNTAGFRGEPWPAPTARGRRILLLGDSQVFGFGIPMERTISSVLAAKLGDATVLNAGVPSWGPPELVLATRELAAVHHPDYVVFVANAANDWFELSVPNVRRTTAVDGWAERVDSNRKAATAFPGRDFLYGRSHLVLAVRQLIGYLGRGEMPQADAALTLARDVAALRTPHGGHRSRMTAPLLEARAACVERGCTVIAAALPLDVQVDPAEWKKYRHPPVELAATLAILDDFVADAIEEGIAAVNLTGALRAAEPGAFLADDYHLSPRGADAVASALAAVIEEQDQGRTLARQSLR